MDKAPAIERKGKKERAKRYSARILCVQYVVRNCQTGSRTLTEDHLFCSGFPNCSIS